MGAPFEAFVKTNFNHEGQAGTVSETSHTRRANSAFHRVI